MSRNPSQLARARSDRASVLIIVLWVSLTLVTLTLLFGQSVMLSYRACDNALAREQALQAADGAVRYVTNLLANADEPGVFPSTDQYEAEDLPVGEARLWLIGRDPEETLNETTPYFGLVDEASKLNLNTATAEMLEKLPGMTPELAAAIVDWRDEDDEPSPDGAESQAYELGDNAYTCKNGPFESVEELALVQGCTWEILYGEDANRNGVLDPNENDGDVSWPPDDRDGVLDPGIIEYLTVWSREPNTQSDGSPRINVNGNRSQLVQLLTEKLGESKANQAVQQIGNNTQFRSALEFFIRSGLDPEDFAQIEDAITVTNASQLEGLVNVATASETVLACLPGMDEAKASQLVAHRSSLSEDQLNSVAWVAEALDAQDAVAIGPWITARSYQISVDAAAVGRNGRGYARVLTVVDLSGEAPEIVYRKDLSALGWALGQAVLDQTAGSTAFAAAP